MIKNYLSLVKFSHTIFALPFALIGFFYALSISPQLWSLWLFVKILICMVTARNAAMAFNRYLDRDIDSKNPRTASRDIPAGRVTPSSALTFTVINALIFFITALFINDLTSILAIPVLVIILGYSYTKRFTSLSHLILGLSLAIAPTAAFIAVTGEFSAMPIMLSFLVFTWVTGFDIIYALQDIDFDIANSLESIPSLMGRGNALIASALFHAVTIWAAIYIGLKYISSPIYMVGAILFSLILVYQHIIVKPNDLSRVNTAFFTLNGIASVLYATITIISLFFFN